MTVRLLTEQQARAAWSGDLLLVRQQRIAFEDMGVMLLRTVVVLMVTLPLWRPVFPEMNFLPYWLALVLAAGALVISHFKAIDIEAARNPQAWLLVANRRTLWLHARAFVNWKWPQDEVTVVAIDLEDIDHLVPLRFADDTPPELSVRLRQPLEDAVIDTILEENARLTGDRWKRRRVRREPVMVEQNLQVLRIRWNGEYPRIRESCDKLRLNFPIEPPLRLEDSDEGLLHDRPRITDEALEEVNNLLRAGDRAAAVRCLREATGMGLAEARALVEQSGWQGGADTPAAPAGQAEDADGRPD